jgi:hypothetical protein
MAELLKSYGGAEFMGNHFIRFHHNTSWAYPGPSKFMLGGQGRFAGTNKQLLLGRMVNGYNIKNV